MTSRHGRDAGYTPGSAPCVSSLPRPRTLVSWPPSSGEVAQRGSGALGAPPDVVQARAPSPVVNSFGCWKRKVPRCPCVASLVCESGGHAEQLGSLLVGDIHGWLEDQDGTQTSEL
eukprot:6757786-Pyramimonas_sp.AAC.1